MSLVSTTKIYRSRDARACAECKRLLQCSYMREVHAFRVDGEKTLIALHYCVSCWMSVRNAVGEVPRTINGYKHWDSNKWYAKRAQLYAIR